MLFNFLSTMKKMLRNDVPAPDQQRLNRMAAELGFGKQAKTVPLQRLSLSWGLGYAAIAVMIVALMVLDTGSRIPALSGDTDGNKATLNTTNDTALAEAYANDYEGASLLALVDDADVEAMLLNLSGDNVKQAVVEWENILPPADD